MLIYQVQSIKDLPVIINHFDKYPLITQKRGDFELFKQAVELIQVKEHLTKEVLNKIIYIKVSMNLGLSDKLKIAFPNTIPVIRPLVNLNEIKNPN